MNRPVVVVTRQTPGTYDIPEADVRIGPDEGFHAPGPLHEFLRSHAPIDALVSMYHDRIDDAALDACGGRLKVVCNFAVGYENIDVEACRRRRVLVCNTPHAVTEGTADMAWTLLLAAGRRLTECARHVRGSEYAEGGPLGMGDLMGVGFASKALLIVGAGRIGRAVALRSIGWGMRVLYTSRQRRFDMEFAPLNAERVALDDGLARADFVSLHVPYSKDTHHLLDARRIGLMKPTAVLVNTSRGAVIDEEALVEALREKRIFGAGLDVFEHEPRLTPGLADLDNAVLTPHVGSGGEPYREMMAQIVCENVRSALAGVRPPFVVE